MTPSSGGVFFGPTPQGILTFAPSPVCYTVAKAGTGGPEARPKGVTEPTMARSTLPLQAGTGLERLPQRDRAGGVWGSHPAPQ